MNLLIIIEGSSPCLPESAVVEKADKVWLLYLSPRVKAFKYRDELMSFKRKNLDIEIINARQMIDFYCARHELLNYIVKIPEKLKIGNSTLSEYLNIHGLNMWWSSGIVEASPYNHNIFQNFYYLLTVKQTVRKYDIDKVWFYVDDIPLEKDLGRLLTKEEVTYQTVVKKISYYKLLRLSLRKACLWSLTLIAEVVYTMIFRIICPSWVLPEISGTNQRSIHLFYSAYPHNWHVKDGVWQHKIYRELPSLMASHLGGYAYYLSDKPISSIIHFFQSVREVKALWRDKIRFIPMSIFLSPLEVLKAYIPLSGVFKYISLVRKRKYRELFILEDINMYYTFDKVMRTSLCGVSARVNLMHYFAFRFFTSRYVNNISQVIYFAEFFDWEVALINGVRNVDSAIPIVGLQQSAPNPTLLSFFFSPEVFKNKKDVYPLPDVIICSGKLYKELMHQNGIEADRVEVGGFLAGKYLTQPSFSQKLRCKKREQMKLPSDSKICLVVCSINTSMTEGVICLLGYVAPKLPDLLFLVKGHPNVPMGHLILKYGLHECDNVKCENRPIFDLLPVSDCLLSTSTSVSQEALAQGIPQVNLDVGGLPYANPLHMMSGLIHDVETPDELVDFLKNTEKYDLPKEKQNYFLGDHNVDPCYNILNIITKRFHGHMTLIQS